MNECIERSLATGEPSSISAAPAPVENADVDSVYFQNGLLKANVSWTVANGEVYGVLFSVINRLIRYIFVLTKVVIDCSLYHNN